MAMSLVSPLPTSQLVDETQRVGDVEANDGRQSVSGSGTSPQLQIARRLEEEIDLRHADLIFLLCYFLAGLCDSTAYKAWKCFVSMQTGRCQSLCAGLPQKPRSRFGFG